jgi:glycosyltransferase involved in cell wall biosynthesis
VNAGYEVTIISVGRAHDEPFFRDVPAGTRIVTLDDKRPGRQRPVKWLLRKLPSVLFPPEDRSFQAFRSLWTDWRLVATLRGKAGFLITTRPGLNLLAADLSPPGLVLIAQEHMHLHARGKRLKRKMKYRYPKLALLAVLTERDRQRYDTFFGGKVVVEHVPNTIRDLGGARADLTSKTVLALGRFSKQKGYDRLLKSWEIAAPHHPDWQLRLCGEGPAQARLERMIERRGLGDSVTIVGPTDTPGEEMAKASIFVMSSRWEGLPLTLLEAMGTGMAVVSFATPTGPADVIDDGRNGMLVRPRKIGALADGLVRMMGDEELRRTCAAGALETAREYSMDTVGPRWEQLLREAWERRRTA